MGNLYLGINEREKIMMDVFSTKLKDYCREITHQEKTSADLAMCSDKLNTRQEVLQKKYR
ncbi:hypothetical protein AGMMS49921_04650 [Endomicrobiia bacterium]|nr:hypothetical protein AGMMS49921_04650 [Endomicrobiia bacterium]